VVPFDGRSYQARIDALAQSGVAIHGEADLVAALRPASVLDAGCGTGRVAIELARRGVDTLGVDRDPSMLAEARRLAPELEWRCADLASLALSRTFDVVVLAGNVPLFCEPEDRAALIAHCAAHVGPGGALVAGFATDRGYALADFDDACEVAGLRPEERYATWDRDPFVPGASYAVPICRRPPVPPAGSGAEETIGRAHASHPSSPRESRA
jgi:SAM-dependent methyltransferase